jgi:hypothetical protein
MRFERTFKKTAQRIGCFMALLRSKSAVRFALASRAKVTNNEAAPKASFALDARACEYHIFA